jgi:prevent-host-death family protein
MKSVGAYEAKTHLPRLLDRVSKGEKITITRHGIPVAVLQPCETEADADIRSTIEALREFRKHNKLAGIPIREMIEEGRR